MRLILLVSSVLFLSACDQFSYKGMNGAQALAHANKLPLLEAYSFYLETHENVHPPMLDVAPTFERFGKGGTDFLVDRAAITSSRREFEADLDALSVLGYRCSEDMVRILSRKSKAMGSGISVKVACGQSA